MTRITGEEVALSAGFTKTFRGDTLTDREARDRERAWNETVAPSAPLRSDAIVFTGGEYRSLT